MNSRMIGRMALLVLLALVVGGSSGFITAESIPGWYAGLNKPWFNPPNWLFGPVWTVLYVLMGVAGGTVWSTAPGPQRTRAMALWVLQLALNALWSIVFFGLKTPGLALAEILLLLLSIALCMRAFRGLHPWAHLLLVPYVLWVSFASVLNGAIWWLN
jgi:translocator protein